MTGSIADWVRPNLARIRPYTPGKPISEVQRELGLTEVIKLGSNENALGPSPRALEAMAAAAREVHLYPDTDHFMLKRALARRLDVAVEQVVMGPGSTSLIKYIAESFLRPEDEVIFPFPSFPMYPITTRLMDAQEVMVPVVGGYHDLSTMARSVTARTRLIYLCNPNNPTGTTFSREQLDEFLGRVPPEVLVVLDEAYFEYADGAPGYPDGIDYVRQGRRMIVLRTLSKVYGLAGLRVGYAVTQPEIAACLRKVREPFAVNSIAQAGALAALDDVDHLQKTLQSVAAGREQIYAACADLGLDYAPSLANFVWLHVGRDAAAVGRDLLQQGVIVRPGDVFGEPEWLRVTVGTTAENARFCTALTAILRSR